MNRGSTPSACVSDSNCSKVGATGATTPSSSSTAGIAGRSTGRASQEGAAANAWGLPSRGSFLHSAGTCTPCRFAWAGMTCRHGFECRFCHLHTAEKRRRPTGRTRPGGCQSAHMCAAGHSGCPRPPLHAAQSLPQDDRPPDAAFVPAPPGPGTFLRTDMQANQQSSSPAWISHVVEALQALLSSSQPLGATLASRSASLNSMATVPDAGLQAPDATIRRLEELGAQRCVVHGWLLVVLSL